MGRNYSLIVFVIFALFALLLLFLVCRWWQDFGVVSDQKGNDFETATIQRAKPIIKADNCKFAQYEKIALGSLAEAYEVTGEDISEYVQFFDEKGKELNGNLSTEKAGEYFLNMRIKSPYSGKRAEKRIQILIDGRLDRN